MTTMNIADDETFALAAKKSLETLDFVLVINKNGSRSILTPQDLTDENADFVERVYCQGILC